MATDSLRRLKRTCIHTRFCSIAPIAPGLLVAVTASRALGRPWMRMQVPAGDIVERESPENASIIQNAFHSPSHRWYYLPAMTCEEAIVFKTYESDTSVPGLSSFALHCAFDEALARNTRAKETVRESIEVRVACFVTDAESASTALSRAGIGSVRGVGAATPAKL